MSNHLFKYIPFSVQQLTSAIEQGTLALPDIQRPFVWPATKVRDLLDSMYRGFPVGQVMFWQTGADPGVRQIGTDDKPINVPYHLIVDGQQRLTSLYAVTTGRPVLRNDFTASRLRIAFNPHTEQFAVADAAIDRNVDWLSDITTVFADYLDAVQSYVDKYESVRGGISRDQEKHLYTVFDRVRDLLGYQFSVVELDGTADEEQVAEVFVRINSEGVTLNQADFILTLMSVFWEKGRKELEEFSRACKTPTLSEASPFNWYIQPQPPQMLRVTAALAFRRAVLKNVYSALRGRDIDTGKADPAKRDAQFAMLQHAQAKVLDITNWTEFLQSLERAGFRGSKMISSENNIVYAYALWLVGRVDYGVPLDRLREVIARWFFMAHITARYSGSFESRFEADVRGLPATTTPDAYVAHLDKIVNDGLSGDFWDITLANDLATSASKSPALLAYIAALNILDADALLSTGKVRTRLDPALTAKKGIERHHLFPRQYLKKHLGITDTKLINQIANMALVEWSDNIKISDQPPNEYWPQQVAEKSKVAGMTPDRLASQRFWHALPAGWEDLEYQDFLEERRMNMAQVVKVAFETLRSEHYSPVYPEATPPTTTGDVSGKSWTDYGVELKDLIEAGLVAAGDSLGPPPGVEDVEATVLPDGRILLDDQEFATPSGAAREVKGRAVNGWAFWSVLTESGRDSLSTLRERHMINEGLLSPQPDAPPDDDDEQFSEQGSREDWQHRIGSELLSEADLLAELASQVDPSARPHYTGTYISIETPGVTGGPVRLFRRQDHLILAVRVPNEPDTARALAAEGFSVLPYNENTGRYRIRIRPGDVAAHSDLLATLVGDALRGRPQSSGGDQG